MDKDTIIQKETQRASDKISYEDNFIARNYWLWVAVAFILYPLATLLSGFTEGGHVLIRTQATMGETSAAWIITILIVVLIELPKFILGKGAIDDIQAGVFSEGGAKLALFIIKFLGFAAVMAFSINLSIKGGPVINEVMRKYYKPVEAEYVDLASINEKYDKEALPYHENISTYSKTTWKGKIVGDARKMIMKEQGIIEGIESRRHNEILAATEENERRRLDYNEHTETNGKWAMGFAGLGEAICIFCLIFIGIYDDGIKAHAKASNQPNGNTSRSTPSSQVDVSALLEEIKNLRQQQQPGYTQLTSNKSKPVDDPNRRKIGFFNDVEMKANTSSETEEKEATLPWKEKEEIKAFNTVQQVLNTPEGQVKMIDARYFKSWMKQSYKRSLTYKTEKARYYNHCLYLRLKNELEIIGWKIKPINNSTELEIIEA